jgi:hypothetical protein
MTYTKLVLLVPLLAVACADSSGEDDPDGSVTPDATTAPDAWFVADAAASPDGSTADARADGLDAAPEDARTGVDAGLCTRTLGGGPSGPDFDPDYMDSAMLAYERACDTTPVPSATVTSGRANEPAGYTTLSERPFNTKAMSDSDRGVRQPDGTYLGGSEGWDGAESSRPRVLRETNFDDAPQSAPNGFRWLYAHDMRSGVSPGTVQTVHHRWTQGSAPRPMRELYISMHIRLSRNWSGNQSNTNKMPSFVGIGGGNNQVFFSAEGKFADPLELQWRMQGIADTRSRIRTGYYVQRGAWEHWEWVLRCNSAPYAADGQLDAWVDGNRVLDVDDIVFTKESGAEAGTACSWNIFSMVPVFGGGGPYVPHDQWIDVDHVYISGR